MSTKQKVILGMETFFVILDCWRQFANLIQDINGGRGAGKGELSWF